MDVIGKSYVVIDDRLLTIQTEKGDELGDVTPARVGRATDTAHEFRATHIFAREGTSRSSLLATRCIGKVHSANAPFRFTKKFQ